ncbi:MAG: RraA family protein [Solirubrobacterales bacterium]
MSVLKPAVMTLACAIAAAPNAGAQLGMFSNEQRVALTAEWTGERMADGRPRVPDAILERMKSVTAEEAWGVLVGAGYKHQFEGGFKEINAGEPGRRLVGRVVTAAFLPVRPDMNSLINKNGAAEGRTGRGQNSWVIDTLKPNDVLVVDLFGKIENGTFAGDNLATSIFTKSGTGLVVDGSVRDLSGILEIKGFLGYVRDFHPTAIADVMLSGINVPIRIGGVTVLPGDVLLSDPEGLTFIPAHLAQKVVESSEDVRLRDDWGHQMLREGKYTPGQIDAKWTPAMDAEFQAWVAARRANKK